MAETVGLATLVMNHGDTLQTASSRYLSATRVERSYDRDSGMLIGERTEFKVVLNPQELECSAPPRDRER